MRILNSNFNIFYPKLSNLRRRFIASEEILADDYMLPTILPIPDDAPEDIPRITVQSKNGHSAINISLVSASLATNYDDNFQPSWDTCRNYFSKRAYDFFNVFSTAIKLERVHYFGLITQVVFDDLQDNPVDIIGGRLFRLTTNTCPYDLNCRVTYTVEDHYHVNINILNVRAYDAPNPVNGNGSLANAKIKEHKLSVILDINDRFAYNFHEGYESSQKEMVRIFEMTNEFVEYKIRKFIETGIMEI